MGKEIRLDPCIMEFLDDSAKPIHIAGDKQYYQTKKNFIEDTNIEFSRWIDKPFIVDDVYIEYVKW